MLISISDFRAMVDRMSPRLKHAADIEEAKLFVGLQGEPNYQRSKIDKTLHERIKLAFTSGHKNIFTHCRELLGQLVHDHEANDAPLDPYFEVLSALKDAVRGDFYDPEIAGDWSQAVQAAVDYVEWTGSVYGQMYEHLFKAEIQQAQAVRRVKTVGKSGRFNDAPKILPEDQRRVLARTIEKRFIRHMGAYHVAKIISAVLSSKFDNVQERYHDVNHFNFTKEMPQRLPMGLLINFAAKYPTPSLPKRHGEGDAQHLLKISRDFAAIYGVQPASNLEAIFLDQKGLLPFLRRLAVHDSMFSPAQTRPSDVVKILSGLMSGLREVGKLPASIDEQVPELIEFVKALQSVIGGRRGPVKIGLDDMATACETLSRERVNVLLQDVFAHPEGSANKNFSIPDETPDDSLPRDDRAGPNYADRPLLTLQENQYLLLDHALNAPAIVEAVLARLRDIGLDADIGYGIEGLLHYELGSRNVRTKTGKYNALGKTWECDIVIETSERVIFVETKKKSLTRAARSGFDVAILADMTDSFVSATLQALRHQLQILKEGFIDLLQPDGSIVRLDLNNREVECISITLPDYGSFQDRIILERILDNSMRLEFSTGDQALQKKLKKVNKKFDELRSVTNDLYIQSGKPAQWRPFVNCWFLSVPQFLVLLDEVTGAEEFDEALNLTRRISTGSRDFYFDFHYAKFLRGWKDDKQS
ncbi:hypothetical protein [Janthinobacterium lividum]|uniref:Restriction endonuclease n=1 Tax=Janthinobacterium lividum TaxID=29581 RepID=A0ABU0Y2C5_9BURK|nr:hypothetical protein [Janthinobacterium lividum]MDQ4629304.1 hypothetical protein [Janthinobacterium lividum]MDQ4676377.1 hypothetical protein [Janthinobacterium lividum]MDQ4688699.1 hypothetical protein [Janthinobacterium lividum]